MLEIRGEMISILDPNYTREQETLSDRSDKKVLIFTANGKNYGLTVDSINSIVNFNEEDKIPVPEMANTSSGKTLFTDFEDAIQIDDKDSGEHANTLLILNLNSIIEKFERKVTV